MRRIVAVEIDFTEDDAAAFLMDLLNGDPIQVTRARFEVAKLLALQGVLVKMETLAVHMNINKSDWQIQMEKEREELAAAKEEIKRLVALLEHSLQGVLVKQDLVRGQL